MDLGKCHDSLESSSSWSTICSHKLSDEIEDLNEIEDSVASYLQCLGVKVFSDPTQKEFLYNQVQKDKFFSKIKLAASPQQSSLMRKRSLLFQI